MDIEHIRKMLPEAPPEGLVGWAERTQEQEFGLPFCSWKSERIKMSPRIEEVMEYNSLKPRRSIWVADCRCGACLEDFYTAKVPGEDAIMLEVGEDGCYYTAELDGPWDPNTTEIQRSGDEFYCPICGSKVELVHRKKLTGGRIRRLMVAAVQVVEGHLAVVYWLVWRKVDEWGCSDYGATAKSCYILDERGVLHKFAHMKNGFYGMHSSIPTWEHRARVTDDIDDIYQDWGSICNKKRGCAIWPEMPDLTGTTGEKTGLIEYLGVDGCPIISYLKLWRKARGVENLCKTGQGKLVADIVRTAWRYSYSVELEAAKYLDLKAKKPYEMIGCTRVEYRAMRKAEAELTCHNMEKWREYQTRGGSLGMVQFMDAAARFGAGITNAMELMREHPGLDLPKLERYMQKQGLPAREVYLLLDTRKAMRKLNGGLELTREELWPKNLRRKHDEVTLLAAQREKEKATQKLQEGFDQILGNYGQLEWTDGELCMVLPRSNDDLIREGAVLRHCVGMYGNGHTEGRDVIFFVRHYRRPERPYYTLDINMIKDGKRVQLHGYGNERHGPNKEYTHTIPRKVTEFCDRWEKEILRPFMAQRKRIAQEAKTA